VAEVIRASSVRDLNTASAGERDAMSAAQLLSVGVAGATGLVGREFLKLLARRNFPVGALRLFGSARSAGTPVHFGGRHHIVEDLQDSDPKGLDLAFFSVGKEAARTHVPRFADQGVLVVDNSSAFRERRDVPLVVPEVNAADLTDVASRIVANPNCSTIIMVVPVACLHRAFGVAEIVVSTYQAVSGAGRVALEDLLSQARAFAGHGTEAWRHYDRPIFMNLIPKVGPVGPDGDCTEERKMVAETRRMLRHPSLRIYATTVRVPVERCHSESILVRLEREVTADQIRAVLQAAPGITLTELPTPRELIACEAVHVGRLRVDPDNPRVVRFWAVADQLWKGAALNAIQIAEHLIAAQKLAPTA
jgi:aspartate-semialdehyde dehydrogenase